AYWCREEEEIHQRLLEQDTPVKDNSLKRYLGDAKNEIIKRIFENNKMMQKIEKKIEEEYVGHKDKI
ncbi:MAG: hypothetical protein MJB14_13115, partial [Spirochaetes bacterium]|nr:hypothetical protein [Spirochaetota bacterium]